MGKNKCIKMPNSAFTLVIADVWTVCCNAYDIKPATRSNMHRPVLKTDIWKLICYF